MNLVIALYFVAGLCFGLATFGVRHHCSEGSVRPADQARGLQLGSRLYWAVLCSALWPLLGLTGLMSWRRLARAKRRG